MKEVCLSVQIATVHVKQLTNLNAVLSFHSQEKVTEFGILKENMFAFWDVSNSGNTKTD